MVVAPLSAGRSQTGSDSFTASRQRGKTAAPQSGTHLVDQRRGGLSGPLHVHRHLGDAVLVYIADLQERPRCSRHDFNSTHFFSQLI